MEIPNIVTQQPQQQPQVEAIPVEISNRSLLQAGAHFGCHTSKWIPKCAPYIYGVRNSTYIINLDKTLEYWSLAREVIVSHVEKGGSILFVGTKRQARDVVYQQARRCGEPYVSYKWNAGTLTNFDVVRSSIAKMNNIEKKLSRINSKAGSSYTKKEAVLLQRDLDKMEKQFGGVRHMNKLPALVFITDARIEDIAVTEANAKDIPIIALADTDCNPAKLTHIIPANDDAIRSLSLFCAAVADAVLEGKQLRREALEMAKSEQAEAAVEAEIQEKTLSEEPTNPKKGKKQNWHNRDTNNTPKNTKVFAKTRR